MFLGGLPRPGVPSREAEGGGGAVVERGEAPLRRERGGGAWGGGGAVLGLEEVLWGVCACWWRKMC